MGRAQANRQRISTRSWHTFVWFALIAALLALRFTPPDLTVAHDHEVLLKHSAAHDKRPCVQRPDAEFRTSDRAITFAPVLTEFHFLLPHSRVKAREANTALYNRPPPVA
jgi:hypothetical protein